MSVTDDYDGCADGENWDTPDAHSKNPKWSAEDVSTTGALGHKLSFPGLANKGLYLYLCKSFDDCKRE